MKPTNLKEVLEECMVMSGNAFIEDLDAVGFSGKQFVIIVRNALRKFLDYRSIITGLSIPYTGELTIMLSQYMDPVPNVVSAVTIDGARVGFRYTGGCGGGKLTLDGVYPGKCLCIHFKSTDGLGLLFKIDPNKDDNDISNWEFGFDNTVTRFSELNDLILANFKIALGGAVRRFQIQEIPIGLDGDSLISEGKQLLDETIQQLQETSDCYDNILAKPEFQMTFRGIVFAPFGML